MSRKVLRELKQNGFKIWPRRKFRKGQKNKWLPELRKIIGNRSQKSFAAMIGVSPDTIASIEIGRNKLAVDLASKIRAATGINIQPYFMGDDRLLNFDWTPFTNVDFQRWRTRFGGNNEKQIAEWLEEATDSLSLILKATQEIGTHKNHLPALKLSFYDWCNDVIKQFQLAKSLDAILKKERAYIDEMTMSYRDWRRKEAEPLRAYYDFVDNEKEPEEKDLTRRIKTYTPWNYSGVVKLPKNGIRSMVTRF